MTMQGGTLTWKDVVAEALRQCGGQAHLAEIYARVEGHPKTATNPTWRDTIRRVVRQYTIFEPVPPERSGVYKLIDIDSAKPRSQSLDSEASDTGHGTAQGMLVTLGNVYGYETFVPRHDQTVRSFQDTKLSELVSVASCDDVFRGPNLAKIRQIDVLWFDEDDYGLFPTYAFEVEHTTRVRDGLDRLLKIPRRFPVRLFVVGPGADQQRLFDRYVNQTPFRSYRDRFSFRAYKQLQDVYNLAVEHSERRQQFGLLERYREA